MFVVDVAEYYRFDGWLVNIEVPLKQEGAVEDMCLFVSQLTQEMHRRLPGSLVIWYDSVTKNGDLAWQDQLNDLNRGFFDAADGLFSNYCWKEEYPQASAVAAGVRRRQVFMGCDIFGRNTFGGGGFNAHKALKVIAEAHTSVALFAPAWTYETFEKQAHADLDSRFWTGDGQPATSELGSIADYVQPRICSASDMLHCSFDRGFGERLFLNGALLGEGDFGNIHRQSVQPTWIPWAKKDEAVFASTGERAFNGGTSLRVTLGASHAPVTTYYRLFLTRLGLLGSLRFCFAVAPTLGESKTHLSLRFTLNTGVTVTPLAETRNIGNGWFVHAGPVFSGRLPDGEFIREVGLEVEHRQPGSDEVVFLGEVSVYDQGILKAQGLLENDDHTFEPENPVIANLVADDIITIGENNFVTLSWEISPSFKPSHFNVYEGSVFLGTAFCSRFRARHKHEPVEGQHTDGGRRATIFTVQPVSSLGVPQQLSTCLRVKVF